MNVGLRRGLRREPASIIPAGFLMPSASPGAAPAGWLLCDGASYAATDYPDLFAAIGYTYGGSGANFNVPNLKGRVVVGVDAAQSEFDVLGETAGDKTVSVGTANLPAHTHTVNHDHAAFSSAGGSSHSHTVNHDHAAFNSAGGSAHDHGLQNHNHGGGTGIHAHQVTAGLGGGNIGLTAGGSQYNLLEQVKGTNSVGIGNSLQGSTDNTHNHSIDVPNFTGSSGPENTHTHSVDVPNFTGSSGDGGFAGTALSNLQPYMALPYLIKV